MRQVLNYQQTFPTGTTVKAYLASHWPFAQLPPEGAPKGASSAEAVVAANGDIAFDGLTEAETYYAAGEVGGAWRYVRFLAAPATAPKVVGDDAGELAAGDDERFGRLWDPRTSDTLLSAAYAGAQATRTVASGQIVWYGGYEMIAPAGRPIGAIKWLNFNASTVLTNCFACLGLPDENGDPWVTILATSKDFGAAAWAEKTIRKFSLAVADGGTGLWTPEVDTPVMLGVCPIGSGLPTLSGINIANEEFAKIRAPWFYSRNPKNLKSPAELAGGTYELETQAVAYCGCAATESSA